MSHFIIIIPAKNESSSVATVIKEAQAKISNATILVVDDASDDDTAKQARAAGAKVINLMFSLGAWGAIQTGMRYALQHGYKVVVTMDADGQHEADSLPVLLNTLQTTECDVVIGAYPERGSPLRHMAWRLFRHVSGVGIEDLTSGLRAYNQNAILVLASAHATLLDYQDMGVLILLQRSGLKIVEVAITMRPRLNGHSRIFNSWWTVGRYMLQTLVLCVAQSRHIERITCRIKSPSRPS